MLPLSILIKVSCIFVVRWGEIVSWINNLIVIYMCWLLFFIFNALIASRKIQKYFRHHSALLLFCSSQKNDKKNILLLLFVLIVGVRICVWVNLNKKSYIWHHNTLVECLKMSVKLTRVLHMINLVKLPCGH